MTLFVSLINTLLDPHWGGSVLAQTQAESSFESLVIPYFLRIHFMSCWTEVVNQNHFYANITREVNKILKRSSLKLALF